MSDSANKDIIFKVSVGRWGCLLDYPASGVQQYIGYVFRKESIRNIRLRCPSYGFNCRRFRVSVRIYNLPCPSGNGEYCTSRWRSHHPAINNSRNLLPSIYSGSQRYRVMTMMEMHY